MGSTNIDDLYKDKFRENQLYLKEKNDLSVHNNAFMAGGKQKLVYLPSHSAKTQNSST
jgi:hypothetical protein